MSAPPQARSNSAQHADRNARVFNLRVAGLTVRAIAVEVGLSPTRVQEILTEEVAARIGPPAEDYVTMREAELSALWSRTYRLMASAEDTDTKLKAVDRLVKINESRRRLRGADAPEALTIALERRVEEESADVVQAVIAAVQAVTAALPLPDVDATYRARLQNFALEVASRSLSPDDGPAPDVPRMAVAELEPASADRPEPAPPAFRRREPDATDDVMDQLAQFEDEFGPLEDDDE